MLKVKKPYPLSNIQSQPFPYYKQIEQIKKIQVSTKIKYHPSSTLGHKINKLLENSIPSKPSCYL